jgi:rare lipoprotein A
MHHASNYDHLASIGSIGLQVVVLLVLLAMLTSASAAHPAAKAKSNSAKTTQVGLASYYGKGMQGKKTASGEKFDKNDLTAAHPTYPPGTRLRVTNLRNHRSVNVRVNDRGPAHEHRAKGVIIDLSEGAAAELGFRGKGKARVKTELLERGKPAAPPNVAAAPPAPARDRGSQRQRADSD